MVATDTPLKTRDKARGTRAGGTSRIATAVAMLQNPPSAMPSSTRASSSKRQVGRRRHEQVGHDEQGREPHQHEPAIEAARDDRGQQAGKERHDGGGGDRLSGEAFGNVERARDRGQQAGGQELRRHQAEDAQRQGEHGRPRGLRPELGGVHVCSA